VTPRWSRERLQMFLAEVMFASRRYGLLIDRHDDEQAPTIVDIEADTIVGLDLKYVVNADGKVAGYACEDSILDGVWPVQSSDGSLVEQRYLNHDPARRAG
jgi:hypothetical protein